MDLRQLRYFVKIVEQGSMSRAAGELCIAQSAISLQVSTLETRLGHKLLVRRSTGVEPTEAGQALYRHAVAILRQVERASHDVAQASSEASGPVTLGLPMVVAELLAVDLFVTTRVRLPKVALRISDGMSYLLREMTLHGRLDMTVTYQFDPAPGIVEQPLFSERLYLVSAAAGKRLHAEGVMSLEDAARCPLVLPSGPSGVRRVVEAGFSAAGLQLEPIAEIDSLRALVEIARLGHGYTILPATAIQLQLRDGSSSGLRLAPLELSRQVALCTSEHLPLGRAAVAVQELLEVVVGAALREKRWIGVGPPDAERRSFAQMAPSPD